VRRVFNWSEEQYAFALRTLKPDFIFGNFFNYIKSEDEANKWIESMMKVEEATLGKPIDNCMRMFGIGPCVEDVMTFGEAVRKQFN
jgi:hypothetical protein